MEGIFIKRNECKDVLRRKNNFICTCRSVFLAWYFVSAGFSLPNEMSIAWCFQNVQWNNHNKRHFWEQQR